MFQSFTRRLIPVVALVVALGVILPASASANSPILNEAKWNGGPGSSPANAIPIVGTVRNQLDPGKSLWYTASFGGAPPWGVTLNYTPGNLSPASAVQLRVDWTTPNGTLMNDWPGYYRVGEGSQHDFAPGVLYWTTSALGGAPYAFEVVNNSTVPIGYALAVTGSAFPPPDLNPPAPLETLPPLES